MSQSQTSGYDILVQLSEQELNAQLQTAVPTLPAFNQSGFQVTPAFVGIELDNPLFPNCVHLLVDIAINNLPSSAYDVAAPIRILSTGNLRQLQVVFDVPGQLAVTPANFVGQGLQSMLATQPPLNIGPPMQMPPPGADPLSPLTPTDVDVKVIDAPLLGTDCITFMLHTGSSTGGNAAGVTQYLGNSPSGAVVVLSNQLLVERIIRPALAAQLGATFDPPCVLREPVLIYDGGDLTKFKFKLRMKIYLQSMQVYVEGDHLRVVGSIGGSGTGWSVTGNFSVRLYLQLNNGTITVLQATDTMEAHFDFDWWVWVLAALTAGSLGVLLVAFVQGAVNRIIDRIESFAADIASKFEGISVPSIPLGPSGGSLQIQSVLLDDLTLQGPVVRIPAVAAGVHLAGDLYVGHVEKTTVVNGNIVTGLFWNQVPNLPYTITRRFALKGLFRALASQPLMPVTFQWTFSGAALAAAGPGTVTVATGAGPMTVNYLVNGAYCRLWAAAGTSFDNRPLAVTMIDGAGHHTTASVLLNRNAVETITGLTTGLMRDTAVARDDALRLPDEEAPPTDGTSTPVVGVVDRKIELDRAFHAGVAAKPAVNPSPKK